MVDTDPTTRRRAVLEAPFYADDTMAERVATLRSDPDTSVAEAAIGALVKCQRKHLVNQ